jgi:hypothetical protein
LDPNQVACVSCQAVTTNDGRTVWVCENCHTVNTPGVDDQLGLNSTPPATTTPVTPEPVVTPTQMPSGASASVTAPEPVQDTQAAQAALDEAAAMAATTVTPDQVAPVATPQAPVAPNPVAPVASQTQ